MSARMETATTCVICGSGNAPAYAPGPNGAALCSDCAGRPPAASPVQGGTRCAFCRSRIREGRTLLGRRDVSVGLLRDEVVVCASCLAFSRRLLEAR